MNESSQYSKCTSRISNFNYSSIQIFIPLSDYKLCIKNVVTNLSLTGFGVAKLRPIGLMNMLYTTGTKVKECLGKSKTIGKCFLKIEYKQINILIKESDEISCGLSS